MATTIIGKIHSIGNTVNVSTNKEYLKRELILDCSRYDEYTGEKRDNFVAITFVQRRCEELNGYQIGELVEVSFVLVGRKYEKDGQTRYITDINGYKVERKGQPAQVPQYPQAPQYPTPNVQPQQTAYPPQAPQGAQQNDYPF